MLSFTQRPEPEPVFNLEVEGDHCYRVGEQGLLVHNNSVGCDICKDWGVPTSSGNNYLLETDSVTYTVSASNCSFPRGSGLTGIIKREDVVGQTFTHPIVKKMTFRFDGTNKVQGISGSGTNLGSDTWAKCVAGKGESEVAGHVINNNWGGPGRLPNGQGFGIFSGGAAFLNLVPLGKKSNNIGGNYYKYEALVKVWSKQTQGLCVRITFDYTGSGSYPARPVNFKWEFAYKKDGMWMMGRPDGQPADGWEENKY